MSSMKIFLWLYAKYILYLVFTLISHFPLQLQIRKNAAEASDYQTQLLGYWCPSVTVFETMQEEEMNTLIPLLLITNPWRQVLILYKPLDSLWNRGTALDAWACCVPLSANWELMPLFYFLQTLCPYFSFSFSWQRRPRFWPAKKWHLNSVK